MKKVLFLIIMIALFYRKPFAQSNKYCGDFKQLAVKITEDRATTNKSALCVESYKFLKEGEVFLYFNLEQSDTISIYLENSLVRQKGLYVDSLKTGDQPDYYVTLNLLKIKEKRPRITVLYKNEGVCYNFFLDERYKVYAVTSFLEDVFLVKQNYRCW